VLCLGDGRPVGGPVDVGVGDGLPLDADLFPPGRVRSGGPPRSPRTCAAAHVRARARPCPHAAPPRSGSWPRRSYDRLRRVLRSGWEPGGACPRRSQRVRRGSARRSTERARSPRARRALCPARRWARPPPVPWKQAPARLRPSASPRPAARTTAGAEHPGVHARPLRLVALVVEVQLVDLADLLPISVDHRTIAPVIGTRHSGHCLTSPSRVDTSPRVKPYVPRADIRRPACRPNGHAETGSAGVWSQKAAVRSPNLRRDRPTAGAATRRVTARSRLPP
jgi:hypothetical protein